MFPCRETYVFHGGNIRFPKGKHKKCRESLEKMCLRYEISGPLFVIQPAKITDPGQNLLSLFPAFREFFSFFCFRREKFQLEFLFRVGKVRTGFTLNSLERHEKLSFPGKNRKKTESLRMPGADHLCSFFPTFLPVLSKNVLDADKLFRIPAVLFRRGTIF